MATVYSIQILSYLCKPTNDGKYQVLRKCCPKCGSAGLMTDKHASKTNPHGYHKKEVHHREVPEVLTAWKRNIS